MEKPAGKKDDPLAVLSRIVSELTVRGFWGEVTIRFENGTPKMVTTSETTKL